MLRALAIERRMGALGVALAWSWLSKGMSVYFQLRSSPLCSGFYFVVFFPYSTSEAIKISCDISAFCSQT